MAINSRSKGQKAERLVVKLFEKWTKKKFARTPSSGGLQWHRTRDTTGDITCTTEGHRFPFSIEVKSYQQINFQHLLIKPKKIKIHEFWEQSVRDAKRGSKIPLLFMRYNDMPRELFFVVMSYSDYTYFFSTSRFLSVGEISFIKYLSKDHNLVIMRSDDFFNFSYKDLKTRIKTYLKDEKRKEKRN